MFNIISYFAQIKEFFLRIQNELLELKTPSVMETNLILLGVVLLTLISSIFFGLIDYFFYKIIKLFFWIFGVN